MTTTLFPSTATPDRFDRHRLRRRTDRASGSGATAVTVAGRTLRQFVRTPQLIVVGALTSAMFLLIFRYVFGGAIGTGDISYADFLIPGLAAAGACSPAWVPPSVSPRTSRVGCSTGCGRCRSRDRRC